MDSPSEPLGVVRAPTPEESLPDPIAKGRELQAERRKSEFAKKVELEKQNNAKHQRWREERMARGKGDSRPSPRVELEEQNKKQNKARHQKQREEHMARKQRDSRPFS